MEDNELREQILSEIISKSGYINIQSFASRLNIVTLKVRDIVREFISYDYIKRTKNPNTFDITQLGREIHNTGGLRKYKERKKLKKRNLNISKK